MDLHEEILEIMKSRMSEEHKYINPHFMQKITNAIYDYYEIEDDELDQWILDMFGS